MSVPGGAEEGPPPQRNKPTESKERNARYRYRAASYSVCLYIIVRYCAEYGTPRCGIPGLASAVPCRTVHAVRRNFGRWICAGVDLFLPLCREPFVSVIHAGIGQATTKEGKARQGNPGHNEYNISNACIHTHTSANEIHLPLSQKVRNVLYCIALHWIALRCTEATPLGARKDRTNEHHALCRKVRSKEHNQAMASLCGQLASFIHSLFRFGSVRFSHPLCFSTSYCM